MKVTVSTVDDEIYVLEVFEDMELENFRVYCEIECGYRGKSFSIHLHSKPLEGNKKTLKEHGVQDGDMLLLVETSFNIAHENYDNQGTYFQFVFILI